MRKRGYEEEVASGVGVGSWVGWGWEEMGGDGRRANMAKNVVIKARFPLSCLLIPPTLCPLSLLLLLLMSDVSSLWLPVNGDGRKVRFGDVHFGGEMLHVGRRKTSFGEWG